MAIVMKECDGCGVGLSHFDRVAGYRVCYECTKARQKSATTDNRCHCGKRCRESEVHTMGSRQWTSCLRCLGTVRQFV